MKRFGFLLAVLLLASVLGLVACGSGASPIEDTTWVLESYGEPGMMKLPLPNIQITVYFDSATEELTGDAGCNTYSGGYQLNDNQISFPGGLAITEMWCGGEVAQQEAEYMQMFTAADSFEVNNGNLQLNCDGKLIIYNKK